MTADEQRQLIRGLWPAAAVLWMPAVLGALGDRASGYALWLAIPVTTLAMCLIAGLCAACIGGLREESCGEFLRVLGSRARYIVLPSLSGTSIAGVLSLISLPATASCIGLIWLLVALPFLALSVLASAAGGAGRLGLIGAYRAATRLIWLPSALVILFAPLLIAVIISWFTHALAGEYLSPPTVDALRRTVVIMSNGLFSAWAAVFCWSRLPLSERVSTMGSAYRCVCGPVRIILASWLGAMMFRIALELVPVSVISWGRFLSADIPLVVNVPYSFGSLVVAIVGIAAIVAISGTEIASATLSVVVARMLFVATISVAGPSSLGHGSSLWRVAGRVAALWPKLYLAGLIVYAVLTILWVSAVRRFRHFRC